MQDLLGHAKDLAPSVVALRRDLHRWPELGLHTPRTRDAVLAALEGLPLDVTLHDTTSGVAALLTGGRPGPTVLLRGDAGSVPCGFTEDGMPVGLQVVGPSLHDLAVLRAMAALEALFAHDRVPAVHV